MNKNNKFSIALPIILNYINISILDDATPLFNFSLGVFFIILNLFIMFFVM